MPQKLICPFMSFHAQEQIQPCWGEKCALWIIQDTRRGLGWCSFSAIASRLDAANAGLENTNRQLSGIAARIK